MGVALVLVVALAAGLRLFDLGVPSFRADTMLFFDICHRPVSGWVVFTQWMELMGRTSQLPFSLAITKLFIDIFHLAPTAFMIRLPNALFGILTVLGMYMLGRQMAGLRQSASPRQVGRCLGIDSCFGRGPSAVPSWRAFLSRRHHALF